MTNIIRQPVLKGVKTFFVDSGSEVSILDVSGMPGENLDKFTEQVGIRGSKVDSRIEVQ